MLKHGCYGQVHVGRCIAKPCSVFKCCNHCLHLLIVKLISFVYLVQHGNEPGFFPPAVGAAVVVGRGNRIRNITSQAFKKRVKKEGIRRRVVKQVVKQLLSGLQEFGGFQKGGGVANKREGGGVALLEVEVKGQGLVREERGDMGGGGGRRRRRRVMKRGILRKWVGIKVGGDQRRRMT